MRTIELTISVPDGLQELLIAILADRDFEGFVQEDTLLKAYVPAPHYDDTTREGIERWLRRRELPPVIRERIIEEQNWNAAWEQTVRPQAVGPFLIKPPWAEVPPDHVGKIVIRVEPKMSFGTGEHASTRLALRLLPPCLTEGARILDAGTGTGILAIAAAKQGAAEVIAFDIDPWAQDNAVENIRRNAVADRVHFRPGTIAAVPETDFDLILANINRAVLLELLPAFARKLKPAGRLILAGLLTGDRSHMIAAAAEQALAIAEERVEDGWWAVVLGRSE